MYRLLCVFSLCALAANPYEPKLDMQEAHWGIAMIDAKTGESLVTYNADKLFIPASVTKIVTTATALEERGVDATFRTSVYRTEKGDLVLKGVGDPSLKTDDLIDLAKQVKLAGIRSVPNLIADESRLLSQVIAEATVFDTMWYYAPELSALSIDNNAVKLVASSEGLQFEEKVPYFTIDRQQSDQFDVLRDPSSNRIVVQGELPTEPVVERIAVHKPAEYAARIFAKALSDNGIEVGKVVVGTSKEPGLEIAYHESPPMWEIVQHCNKRSDNLYAELLFQMSSKKDPLLKGSGLKRNQFISPEAMTSYLFEVQKKPYFYALQQSLPVWGVDGTAAYRLHETSYVGKVFAKTGTMGGVCAMAGYATTKEDRKVIVAIFVNNFHHSIKDVRKASDALLVEMLDEF